MNGPREEQVIVVPTRALRAFGPAPGFESDLRRFSEVAIRKGLAESMPRSHAEGDPRFKQLVAYVVLRWEGRLFHYLRSDRAGEKRLARRRSLGLGGHLNADDWKGGEGWDSLARGIARELSEEVELDLVPETHYVGVIDDDTEPVSRVHLGVVALADLESPRVTLSDTTLSDARFSEPGEILAELESFEGWSRLCFPWISPPEGASESRRSLGPGSLLPCPPGS